MSDNQTTLISQAAKTPNVRVLADGILAFADEIQDLAVESERRSKIRKLAANFLMFVNDSMDDGMLQVFEDDLQFMESCMEVFIDTHDVENDAGKSAQHDDADQQA